MGEFIPRLEAPSDDDLNWIKTTHGGYNKCIVIDEVTGSVLPNCTGYAWGRFLEENNITDCNLSRGNGGVWYSHNDGYQRGITPRLGAVICWDKVGGDGHVAVVEEIKPNGDITTSNSAYNGSRFFIEHLTRASNYSRGSLYSFQGFIYPIEDFGGLSKKRNFKWVLYSKKFRNQRNKL
jgi:surface antigen